MAITLADQLKSLRRYLENRYPGRPVFLERPAAGMTAPAFLIEHLQTSSATVMPRLVEDQGAWQITYVAHDQADALAVLGGLKSALSQDRSVPAYLFDYQHPALLRAEAIPGDMPAGTYQVQVTGFGQDDSESLPSEPAGVTLTSTGGIRVRIPRLYAGATPIIRYGVYVNGSRQAVVAQDDVGHTDYDIQTLPAAGALQPPQTAAVYDRPMRVHDVAVHQVKEESGAITGFVRLRTKVAIPTPVPVGEKLQSVVFTTDVRRS